MSDLLPCPCCRRHVRASEIGCPFCACALPEHRTRKPVATQARGRMSRAALLAAGAALMGAAACDENVAVPVYGAPAADASADSADASQSEDTNRLPDAITLLDTAGASDVGTSDMGQVAIYGAPALPSR